MTHKLRITAINETKKKHEQNQNIKVPWMKNLLGGLVCITFHRQSPVTDSQAVSKVILGENSK